MLPIAKHRDAILKSVSNNQVTIIVGETGSGKTTAVPQFLYEAGFGKTGLIGITEPRRIAAISVAKFVASNLNVTVGKTVAHKIRFDDTTDVDTVVKFMTDGILLREFHDDPLLSKYSVIMVDEAHERSANIDFLLGLLKQVLAKRSDLRVVVASATIDAEKFSNYFSGAPVLKIDGRLHHVQVVWGAETASSSEDVVPMVVSAVKTILDTSHVGDILVFLTGIDEINTVSDALERMRGTNSLAVLPVHGSLAPEDQSKVFQTYPGQRKVVLATNIAETSITIDGVVFVVDAGLIKQTHFDSSVGVQSLDAVKHSKAGCAQRTGRAGRTQPGVCYRLYTMEDYERRPAFTEPEIKRMSLAGVVLAMEALEIPNIKNFDFIDPPNAAAFSEAYDTLEALGAIVADKPGLTKVGTDMAALPLEPRVARMVIEAQKYGCVDNIVTVASFLSVGRNVFSRPKDKEREADKAHYRFKNHHSDMLSFLHIWLEYEASDNSRNWCFENFLAGKALQEIKNIRQQLLKQLARSGVEITKSDDNNAILRSIASGLAYNLLRFASRHAYEGVERELYGVYIHPGSSVFGGAPQWMVSAELVETSKLFARMCSEVKVEWLPEIASTKFSVGESKIKSYTPGASTVEVTKQILYKDRFEFVRSVGEVVQTVSLDEARKIQHNNIEQAKAAGFVLVVAEKDPKSDFDWSMIGRAAGGKAYRVSSISRPVKIGCRYYCKVEEPILASMLARAYPEMQVFDFPPVEIKLSSTDLLPKPDILSNVKVRPSDGSVGELLAAALQQRRAGV